MEYVKPITSDHDQIELTKRLNKCLDGVLAIQEIKEAIPRKGSYIILLRATDGIGHWVCTHDGMYFDPIGVSMPEQLGNLKFSEIQYQGTYSDYCGVYCVLWLYCRQKNKMNLMKQFNDLDIKILI